MNYIEKSAHKRANDEYEYLWIQATPIYEYTAY